MKVKQNGKISIRAQKSEEKTTISLADNGLGMSGEVMDRLFKADNSYSTNGTHNEQGAGLGLLLCRDMVTMNNGKIWAESRQGAGSIFYFTLPTAKK